MAGAQRPTTEQVTVERRLIEGKKYELISDWDKAEAAYRAILDQDPLNGVACYELSRTLMPAGKPREALPFAQKAVRLEADNEWYLLMEADIHEKIGDMYAAMEVYERLIRLRPDQPHFYEVLIDLSRRAGDTERMLRTLDAYETITGVTESVSRLRFETLDELGRTNDALAALERLSEAYPTVLDYKFLVAAYARKIGREDKAVAYYKSVLALEPENDRARLALAGVEKQQGNDAGYLASIAPVIENPALEIDVKLEEIVPYVLQYSKTGDPGLGAALDQLSLRLVKAHPKEAKAYALRGDIRAIAGDDAGAATAYGKAVELDPNVYLVWEQLIGTLMRRFDYAGVLKQASTAVDYFPNQGFLYYAAGWGAYYTRDYAESTDWLDQALPMTVRNTGKRINVLNMLGLAWDRRGDVDKSVGAFEESLALNPDNIETMAFYALSMSQRIASSQKAMEMAGKVAGHPRATPQLLRVAAEVYVNQKQPDKALQAIERAVKGPLDPEGYRLAGDIFDQASRTAEALTYWQMALDAGLKDEALRQKVNQRKTQ
jgi:tetratricopeptide (TPR) repeat protein